MKNTYNVIIIDDEPIAIDVIKSHLKNFLQFTICGSFTNAFEAVQILNEKNIDLLFLDIEMPGINGVDFLKALKHPPSVIFTTAYREYAVEAFDLDVIDYLLKPISLDRFFKATNRFFEKSNAKVSVSPKNDEFIDIKADKKYHKINIKNILYIEGLDDYIKLYLIDKNIVTYMRMYEIQQLLNPNLFIRIHRSYIINLKYVEAYASGFIEINKIQLPVGRKYKDDVNKVLNA